MSKTRKPKNRLNFGSSSSPNRSESASPRSDEPGSGSVVGGAFEVSDWLWVGAFAIVFTWSYWATFFEMAERWNAVADYSHGFLVAPLAALFLWLRKDECPRPLQSARWAGLVMITAATAFRYAGARAFLPAFDGWSIPLWLSGVCVWIGGWPLLRWALPSLAFLVFMVPLPYRLAGALSNPLRQFATTASCWTLQSLGQPAVEDGNTILMNSQEFDVAEECSGLRMLVGIVALASAYLMFSRRPWWQKALLCVMAIPVAVLANVIRITVTALLYEHVSSEAGKTFSHDAAGWVTNCLAALLFALVLWLFSRMFTEYEVADRSSVIGLHNPAG